MHLFQSRKFRSAVFAALDICGFSRVLGGPGPRILLYHGVTEDRSDGIFNYREKFVNTGAFRSHMAWIKKRYRVLPLRDFVEMFIKKTLHDKDLCVTFDDGYKNNYTDAYPVLRELDLPATFFITTNFIEGAPLPVDRIEYTIGTTTAHEIELSLGRFELKTRDQRISADLRLRSHLKKLSAAESAAHLQDIERATSRWLAADLQRSSYAPMTPSQMQEMESHGMTFAAHTISHPILARLPAEEQEREIQNSAAKLATWVKDPLTVFAYPNGGKDDYNDVTIQTLKRNGFIASLTTHARSVAPTDDPFRLPRYTMDGASDIHRARLMVSGAYYKLL